MLDFAERLKAIPDNALPSRLAMAHQAFLYSQTAMQRAKAKAEMEAIEAEIQRRKPNA